METRTAEVNSFSGQTYGYFGEIRISFHCDKKPVRYHKGWTEKHKHYHLDASDIELLHSLHPELSPPIGHTHYEGYVTEWGYDVEDGLCELMIQGLELKRKDRNNFYHVTFFWVGEPWDAQKQRKQLKKRRVKKWKDVAHLYV